MREWGGFLGGVWIVDPGLLLSQIAATLEIRSRAQASESKFMEFFNQAGDGCPNRCPRLPLHGQGFIRGFRAVSVLYPVDKNRPIEVPVAGISPFELVAFDESFFFKKKR